jgi:hypothetical protein
MAIALAIVKACSMKPNSDGSMPTARIKAIWDSLYETGEVERAFDYHRWKAIRDTMEIQGGLEMVDRRFYTGFVGMDGREIKGRAAKWHMAEWLVEKLDEIAGNGFGAEETDGSLPSQDQGGALLEQDHEVQSDHRIVSPQDMQGGALLEQEKLSREAILPFHCLQDRTGASPDQEELDRDDLGFDHNWIIEFRRVNQPTIGLIWGGTIEEIRREAG